MSNQIRAELFKLQRNKAFWLILLIVTGISALLHYLVIIDWWQMDNTPYVRMGLSEFNAMSTLTVPISFNLIAGTLAGFFISNEFSHGGVIKNQIISGSQRSYIFLSKYLIFTLASIIAVILIPLMTVIIEVLLFGKLHIFTTTGILYLGRAFGLFLLQFLGYTAIIVLLAIATEDSGKTIIISILFTIVMFTIEKLPDLPMISAIYKNSIFYQFSEVFKFSMTNAEIVKSILIALITFIIMILCGIFVFNKKEIK